MKKRAFLVLVLFFLSSHLFSARRALIIGIEHYIANDKYGGMLDIQGCKNDALDMRRILIERFNFHEYEIHLLLNHQATREAILEGLRWLVRETKSQDWVFFSFAGHGTQIKDIDGDEEDGFDECICPFDVEPKYRLNLISDDEINWFIQELKDRNTFFLFDSCHSGTMKRGVLPVSEAMKKAHYFARLLPPPSILEEKPLSRGGRDLTYYAESEKETKSGIDFSESIGKIVVFSAAAPHQIALPVNIKSDHPNGAMTYAVLMGLKGGADKNDDGAITYRELLEFSQDYMSLLRLEQEPQIDAEPEMIDQSIFFLSPPEELSHLMNASSTFNINLRLYERSSDKIKVEDHVKYYVQSERSGYLYLFAISVEGEVTGLFPNPFQKDNFIRGGKDVIIPPTDGAFYIKAVEPLGKMKILAIVSNRQLDLDRFCSDRVEDLLQPLGNEELKELVRSTRDLTLTLFPTEWAAEVIEVEIVR